MALVEIGAARREPLSDTVVRELTRHIVAQSLRPGDPLPSESELGRKMLVSKPVVREALQKLSALGMVDIRQGKPTTVRDLAAEPLQRFFHFALHISPDGLQEAVELRRALEGTSISLAAARITEGQLQELEVTLQQMRDSRDAHDSWVEADLNFHQIIGRASGNVLIGFLITALADSMREVISTLHRQVAVRDATQTLARHQAILDALKARDPAAAAAAMDAHFSAVGPALQAAMTASADQTPDSGTHGAP